jgi:hypothetical protein
LVLIGVWSTFSRKASSFLIPFIKSSKSTVSY